MSFIEQIEDFRKKKVSAERFADTSIYRFYLFNVNNYF